MELYEVSISKDGAWEIMDTFGTLEALHFVDMNKNQQVFTLTYANRIKRIEEAHKSLTTVIESEANRIKFPMYVPQDLESLRNAIKMQTKFKRRSPQAVFELVEDEVKKHVKLIEEQKQREEGMHSQCLELIEEKAVMTVAMKLLNKNNGNLNQSHHSEIKMREGDHQIEAREELIVKGLSISHLAGTINQTEKERLQRLIFRATRGTALTYFQDIERPFIDYRGNKTYKTVYIIIYQEGEYITEKLNRLLHSFLSHTFQIDGVNLENKAIEASNRIKELKKVMKK